MKKERVTKSKTGKKGEVTRVIDEGEYKLISMDDIYPSPSNPRTNFNQVEVDEIASSIKQVGIISPVTVREKKLGKKHYELVVGGKRYRSAIVAELKLMPCVIKLLTDQEVLEIQIIENLHRSDVHPLDEANGYQSLIKNNKYDIQSLVQKFGKSDFYIYQRLKLLDLIAPIKKLFYEDTIILGHAILLARLQPTDQKKTLDELKDYRGNLSNDNIQSPSRLRQWIEGNIMMDLHKVSFKKDDANLVPAAGACTDCSKRTGYNKYLFPELDKKDFCTDPECFKKKLSTHANNIIKSYKDNNIELVKVSENYSGNNKELLYENNYEKATGSKCDCSKKAIICDGTETGKIIDICTDKSCKVHHPYYSSSSGGNKPTPDERYKRRIEIISQPECMEVIKQSCVNLVKDDEIFINDIELLIKTCMRGFMMLESSRRDYLVKEVLQIDLTKYEKMQSMEKVQELYDYEFQDYHLDDAELGFLDFVSDHTTEINLLKRIQWLIIIFSEARLNIEGILKDENTTILLNNLKKLIDVDKIKKEVAVEYDAKRAKTKKGFFKNNGYDPDLGKKESDIRNKCMFSLGDDLYCKRENAINLSNLIAKHPEVGFSNHDLIYNINFGNAQICFRKVTAKDKFHIDGFSLDDLPLVPVENIKDNIGGCRETIDKAIEKLLKAYSADKPAKEKKVSGKKKAVKK
jgi:ParB family chromosome partitioning protein